MTQIEQHVTHLPMPAALASVDEAAAAVAFIFGMTENAVWAELYPAVGPLLWQEYLAMGQEFVFRLRQLQAGVIASVSTPTAHPMPGEYYSHRYHAPRFVLEPFGSLYPGA
jgi:hypothetical protein